MYYLEKARYLLSRGYHVPYRDTYQLAEYLEKKDNDVYDLQSKKQAEQ
jgi:hypothetical protein